MPHFKFLYNENGLSVQVKESNLDLRYLAEFHKRNSSLNKLQSESLSDYLHQSAGINLAPYLLTQRQVYFFVFLLLA